MYRTNLQNYNLYLFPFTDKPDPPQAVRVGQCTSSYADILWEPGDENNDEVIEFIVFYNTSHKRDDFVKGTTVPKGTNKAKVEYFYQNVLFRE